MSQTQKTITILTRIILDTRYGDTHLQSQLQRLSKEDKEFKASLGYKVRP